MTTRVRWAWLASMLLLAGCGGRADERVTPPSSDLPVLAEEAPPVDAAGWLNTAPLDERDLAGKVVLYDFWTFGCINCRHTLPYVKAWAARYARDGLVVIGVHTPEFPYEADPANVASYLAEEQIRFPIALDPERRVWRAWDNHFWPAFYLHDREGRLRWFHAGEGAYAETEDAIRSLLGVAPDARRAPVPA